MFQLVASMSFALTFFVPVSSQNQEADAAPDVSTQVMKSAVDVTEPVSEAAQVEVETSASQRGQTGRRSRDRTRQDRDERGRSAGRRRGEERSGRGSSRRGRESKGRTRSNDRRSGRNPKRDRNRHSNGRSGSSRRGSSRGRSDWGRGRGNNWSRRGKSGVNLEDIHDMLEEILERLDELEERHEDEEAEEAEEEEERERGRSGRRGSDRDGQISSGRGRGRGRSQREQDDEGEAEARDEAEAEEDSGQSRSRRGSRGRGLGDNRDAADSSMAAVARRLATVVDRDKDGTVSEAELTRMPSRLRERFGIKSVVSMPVDELVKKMIEGSANRPESKESVDERRNSPELANEMASRMGDAFDRNNDGTIDEEELARIPQSSRERLNIRGSSSKAEFTKRAAAVFLERMKEHANSEGK